jgi:hypothetical protein
MLNDFLSAPGDRHPVNPPQRSRQPVPLLPRLGQIRPQIVGQIRQLGRPRPRIVALMQRPDRVGLGLFPVALGVVPLAEGVGEFAGEAWSPSRPSSSPSPASRQSAFRRRTSPIRPAFSRVGAIPSKGPPKPQVASW